jgi:hypothetical protein
VRRAITLAVACTLCLLPTRALASAPSNDDFDGAVLTGTQDSLSGTNVGATVEDGEDLRRSSCDAGPHTVWYHWTAPRTPGVLVVDTLNPDTQLDTVLGLYAGGPGIGSLSFRACNDDTGAGVTGSRVLWRVEPRTTYYIRVSGFGSATGTFRLDYRFYGCTIEGTPDVAETLVGTSGDDVICGNGLNEFVRDTVLGLGGNDFLVGGRAEGGPGDDFLWANQVSYVHAPRGVVVDLRDFTGRGEGKDIIYAADIFGSPFADRLSGDGFQNHIFGRNGDDALQGRGAAGPSAGDALYGGKGDDTCDGAPC